jgi:hypothetical protein
MRGFRCLLTAAIVLGLAGIAGATGPMTLTRSGELYTAAVSDNQIMVTARMADGTVGDLFVPQSENAVSDSLQVGVDESTGSLYVLWQKRDDQNARLRLAGLVDGTWIGPYTVAGASDGTAAFNPQMLVYRAISRVAEPASDGREPEISEIANTFLLVSWWATSDEEDSGIARYRAIPLNEFGEPRVHDMEPVDLTDLLPYGFACFDINAGENLKHPKLFRDPQTGNPHLFAADLASCVFQILELRPEVVSYDKRRRQIIILREASMIALRPGLPLSRGKLEVGKGLRIIMHWDDTERDLLHYLELDQDGTSAPKSLELHKGLNHEQAVDLIRNLAH